MTWSDFYLICFAVGFCFSFFSFLFGGSRFGRLHLPHFHGHVAHLPAAHGPVGHAPATGGAWTSCEWDGLDWSGSAAWFQCVALQSSSDGGLFGVVWRDGLFADALFGGLGRHGPDVVGGQRRGRWRNHFPVPQ